MAPIFFTSQAAFRTWLSRHGASASEVWVGFHKIGAAKAGITYKQALDEALCFGWIDGLLKSIDASAFQRRFTPRKPASIWSNVNIARVGELTTLGVMTPAGVAAFEKRQAHRSGVYAFENKATTFAPVRQQQFAAQVRAWTFFIAQAPSYQRVITHWVESAKKEETRARRMLELIARSDAGLWVQSAMLHQPKSSIAAAAAARSAAAAGRRTAAPAAAPEANVPGRAKAGSKAGAKAGAKTSAKTGSKAGSKTGSKTGPKAGPGTGAKSRTTTVVKTIAKAITKTSAKSRVRPNAPSKAARSARERR